MLFRVIERSAVKLNEPLPFFRDGYFSVSYPMGNLNLIKFELENLKRRTSKSVEVYCNKM